MSKKNQSTTPKRSRAIVSAGRPPVGNSQPVNPPTKPTKPGQNSITTPSTTPIGNGNVVNPPTRPGQDQTPLTGGRPSTTRAPQRTARSVYVTRPELLEILNTKLGAIWSESAARVAFIGDEEYYCPPFDEALRMTEAGRSRRRWCQEIYDCDDFAHQLKGYFVREAFSNGNRPFAFAVGVIWVELPFPHALNWVVTWGDNQRNARTLYLLEPQTGQLVDVEAGTGRLRVVTLKGRKPIYSEWLPHKVGGVYVVFI